MQGFLEVMVETRSDHQRQALRMPPHRKNPRILCGQRLTNFAVRRRQRLEFECFFVFRVLGCCGPRRGFAALSVCQGAGGRDTGAAGPGGVVSTRRQRDPLLAIQCRTLRGAASTSFSGNVVIEPMPIARGFVRKCWRQSEGLQQRGLMRRVCWGAQERNLTNSETCERLY